MTSQRYRAVVGALGSVEIQLDTGILSGVWFGATLKTPPPSTRLDSTAKAWFAWFEADLKTPTPVPELPFELIGLPPSLVRILEELRRVPWGETLTYAELARRAGYPRGARLAGAAMARNPLPLLFPCHRVLASNGALHGYGPGLEYKAKLLAAEGARLPS